MQAHSKQEILLLYLKGVVIDSQVEFTIITRRFWFLRAMESKYLPVTDDIYKPKSNGF